jgi:hypothetical protein
MPKEGMALCGDVLRGGLCVLSRMGTKLQNDRLIEYAIQLRVKDHATNDRTASLKVCIETFLFALLFALEKLPHASLKVCIETFLLALQNFHFKG